MRYIKYYLLSYFMVVPLYSCNRLPNLQEPDKIYNPDLIIDYPSPLPKLFDYKPVYYTALQLRDPFKFDKKNDQTQGQLLTLAFQSPREALKVFSLDKLLYVGFLENNVKKWGLIKSPDQIIYRIEVGDSIGNMGGQVTSISANKISVLENFYKSGKIVGKQTISLFLSGRIPD